MRALLLGPNGQLGSDIRRAHDASDAGFELSPMDRQALDVTSMADIERVLTAVDFDVLINCTSYHKTDEAEDNAALAFAVNAHAVKALAGVCAAKRAMFVHVSTDYVFGADSTRKRPFQESDATGPVNVYGASKAMGESLALIENEATIVLRVASLFGIAGASGKGGNFVETMIRFGRERGALRVVDDQVMSPTSTADIAAVVLRMVSDRAPGGVYHVANSGSASWFEFAQDIIQRAQIDATVTPCASADYATRAVRPRYSVLDNSKVSAAFGPMRPWQEALDRYLHEKGHVEGVRRKGASV